MLSEHQLYEQIARYLQLQYPYVIYRFDLAADLKLTAGQAAKHKRLHPTRGFPDLIIYQPARVYNYTWHGLALEIKKDGVRVRKKNGSLVSDKHIQEQAAFLRTLEDKGYYSEFVCGWEHAKATIDAYLAHALPDLPTPRRTKTLIAWK